jgi:YVTN family beta-propeller protein
MDVGTSSVKETIGVQGKNPSDLLFSPAGDYAYAALFGSGAVVRVPRPRHGSGLDRYLTVGKKPGSLALHEDRLWVASRSTDSISIVDCKTFTVVKEVKTGPQPRKIVILPKSER